MNKAFKASQLNLSFKAKNLNYNIITSMIHVKKNIILVKSLSHNNDFSFFIKNNILTPIYQLSALSLLLYLMISINYKNKTYFRSFNVYRPISNYNLSI